jgi:Ca-activated chloride channel family protein
MFVFLFNFSKSNILADYDLQGDIEFHPRHGYIVIPVPPPNIKNPISLKSEDVDVKIKNGVAKVEKTQIFHNNCYATVEGIYVFPLPEGSVISNFALYMGNPKVNGQILSSSEARKIYEEIVRKRRDPALLEFMGQSLFQARIFPINPNEDKRIDLKYDALVKYDNNTYRFVYPLRIPEKTLSAGVLNFSLKIIMDKPITNIYSPTHKVKIDQKNDLEAVVTLSLENQPSDKDFILYFSISDKSIGSSLISYKPYSNEDGYFCLMLSPKYEIKKTEMISKDVIFIIDASGSMLGEKINQAKDALKFCINNLNNDDKFALIDFSNDIRLFNEKLLDYNSKSKDDALYYIDKIEASGGTNLNEAILTALKIKKNKKDRPTMLILLTDGLPTVGVKNPNEIVNNTGKTNTDGFRIFTFGVGYDVDAFLLDKISGENNGSSNYVKPNENIETEISAFFTKMNTPVLSDIKIAFDGVKVKDIYPRKYPDLFYKGQITIFGRYENSGKSNLEVEGRVGENKQKFTFATNFEEKERENDIIANLWANRKVGALLDDIRLNGESKELVDEIIRLAKKFGIVTPYTSYLVTEDESKQIGMNQPLMQHNQIYDSKAGYAATPMESKERAVTQSRTISAMQDKTTLEEIRSFKNIKGKTFILKDGVWTDIDLESKNPKDSKVIQFASDEYFELLNKYPEIKDYLKIGDKISLLFNGRCYKIE